MLVVFLELTSPESVAHATGRAGADAGRLLPGTPEFDAAFRNCCKQS